MTSKKQQQEEEAKKARMMALIEGGATHFRETQVPPKTEESVSPAPEEVRVEPKPSPGLPKVAPEKPAPSVDKGSLRSREPEAKIPEEPVLGPEPSDPSNYLVKRRRSLRVDPQWIGTTLYLRRETHASLQEFCRGAGLDMSRVVQYCVAIQMDENKRSPVLSQLLGE